MSTSQLDLEFAPESLEAPLGHRLGAPHRGVRAPRAARQAHRHLAAACGPMLWALWIAGQRPARSEGAGDLPARHGGDALGRLHHQRLHGSQDRSAHEAHARPSARRAAHRASSRRWRCSRCFASLALWLVTRLDWLTIRLRVHRRAAGRVLSVPEAVLSAAAVLSRARLRLGGAHGVHRADRAACRGSAGCCS